VYPSDLGRMGQGNRSRFSLERWTIRLAPALGMAAIAASALFMTEAEPRWAKVFSGPTDHVGKLALRLEVKRGSLERPFAVSGTVNLVVNFTDKSQVRRDIALDGDGLGWVTFERPANGLNDPVALSIREGTSVLAQGSFFVSQRQWQGGERLEGGWCSGHREGEREIQVGVVDGVVLHSRPSEIVVSISEHGQRLAREPYSISTDGAEIVQPARAARDSYREGLSNRVLLLTNDYGIGRFTIRATDMSATLQVASGSPTESRFVGALPIRAGGIAVVQEGSALIVTSPVALERASIGILTETGLVDVRTVPLAPFGGLSMATVKYDSLPLRPIWAMVSSEAQLDAGNTIGWPLLEAKERSEAHFSRVVPHRLVLDGYHSVTTRMENQRRRVWATSSIALSLVGALLAFAVIRSNRQDRVKLGPLNRLLAQDASKDVTERAPFALIAVVVITAATVALTWWVSLLR